MRDTQKKVTKTTTSKPIPMTTSQSASIQVALGATKWALVGHKFKGTNSRPYNHPCFLISTSIALLTTQQQKLWLITTLEVSNEA